MGVLKKLFARKKHKQKPAPYIPTWNEVVERMHDAGLDFTDEVVKVIYGKDSAKRFVVLKSDAGHYKYVYEELFACDEEELCYCPDVWGSWISERSNHFFDTAEHALAELMQEPEYKAWF